MTTGRIITLADIQIKNILFYDPGWEDMGYSFCLTRNIDCLPALENPQKIYRRDDASRSFVEEDVEPDRIVDASLNIFDPELLEKFKVHPVLLVFSNNTLTGVVHFSDYNQPVVSVYLYEILLNYEKALRDFLDRSGLNNKGMADYFEYRISTAKTGDEKKHYKGKVNAYRKKAEELENLPKFQSFYLKDLIELAEHEKLVPVENQVNDLRNMVMHAHEFVNMENPSTDNLIYNRETFEKFFELALILHKDYKRVKNILAFKSEQEHAQTKDKIEIPKSASAT